MQVNPTGNIKGDERVLRGSSWWDGAREGRPSTRYYNSLLSANYDFGFRVVLSPVHKK